MATLDPLQNTSLPSINDYVKGSDGKYYTKSEIESNPRFQQVDPNAGDFKAGTENILQNFYGLGNSLGAVASDKLGF